jgi:hypothetical protein
VNAWALPVAIGESDQVIVLLNLKVESSPAAEHLRQQCTHQSLWSNLLILRGSGPRPSEFSDNLQESLACFGLIPMAMI